VVNTPASCPGGPGFNSQPGDRLSWLRVFVVFLSPSRRIPGYQLKIRPRPLPSNSFRFIIHLLPYHSTLYSLSNWKSVVKQNYRHKFIWRFWLLLDRWRDCFLILNTWWVGGFTATWSICGCALWIQPDQTPLNRCWYLMNKSKFSVGGSSFVQSFMHLFKSRYSHVKLRTPLQLIYGPIVTALLILLVGVFHIN
jgi:hypothetical protein